MDGSVTLADGTQVTTRDMVRRAADRAVVQLADGRMAVLLHWPPPSGWQPGGRRHRHQPHPSKCKVAFGGNVFYVEPTSLRLPEPDER